MPNQRFEWLLHGRGNPSVQWHNTIVLPVRRTPTIPDSALYIFISGTVECHEEEEDKGEQKK